jgi:hypothetical protein
MAANDNNQTSARPCQKRGNSLNLTCEDWLAYSLAQIRLKSEFAAHLSKRAPDTISAPSRPCPSAQSQRMRTHIV